LFKKQSLILFLIAGITLFTASSVYAQSFKIVAKGIGGFSSSLSDDSNKSGKLGYSAGGGLSLILYFVSIGDNSIGVSTGGEYIFLSYKSENVTVSPPSSELTSDMSYSYLTVPLTLKGAFKMNDRLFVTLDAGPFISLFLGGKSDNSFRPETAPPFTNGKVDLDKDTTEPLDIGLRFASGLEVLMGENLFLTPGMQFDISLKDNSKTPPSSVVASAKDTLWKLAVYIGVGFRIF
jgi:hypothetical protein